MVEKIKLDERFNDDEQMCIESDAWWQHEISENIDSFAASVLYNYIAYLEGQLQEIGAQAKRLAVMIHYDDQPDRTVSTIPEGDEDIRILVKAVSIMINRVKMVVDI